MSDTLYLYGFVPRDTAVPASLAGIGEEAVEILSLDGAADAVISRLDAEVFDADRLEERMQDMAWVAEQGLAHERIVAWFVDHAEILPVRLFTLYSSEDALRQDVAGRQTWLADRLERFAGLREWDLKVAYERERLIDRLADLSAEIRDLDRQIAAADPGRRFLLERKRKELARTEAGRGARRTGRELLDRLRPLAREVTKVEAPRAAGDGDVVLNAALLVERAREAELGSLVRERAAELDEIGIRVIFSGPWAPYRFLGDEETDGES